MNKKINFNIKLQIPSQEANPSPRIGPILGQKGVNIIEFCKEFNDKTINIEKGLLTSVTLCIYSDKTFSMIIKSSPVSVLLKKIANIKLGSKTPGKEIVATINIDDIYYISNIKFKDMNSDNIESINKSIIGTAKSMGINII